MSPGDENGSTSCSPATFGVTTFETGTLDGTGWGCSGNCPEVVEGPARAGQFAMRSFLDADLSEVTYRTEVDSGPMPDFQLGQEYWVGLSFMLPDDWSDVYGTYDGGLLVQWHHRPWLNEGPQGELPLTLSHTDGTFLIRATVRDDTEPRGARRETLYQAPYVKGVWIDWVFHVRFSTAPDGFIEIWRNGVEVASVSGANYWDVNTGPYIKMALPVGVARHVRWGGPSYHPAHRVPRRVPSGRR